MLIIIKAVVKPAIGLGLNRVKLGSKVNSVQTFMLSLEQFPA